MTRICGIDPGVQGAIAFLLEEEVLVFDIPIFTVKKGQRNRKFINAPAVHSLFCTYPFHQVFIEETITFAKESAAGAHSSGRAFGVLEGILAALGHPITIVPANVWKKAMGLTKDKELSRQRATQLWPDASHQWDRKKDQDRAEAVLIAEYGLRFVKDLL
jgi:crossover junction endodeoxyribonuclease RuvC